MGLKMNLIKFSDEFIKKSPELFDIMPGRMFKSFVKFIIDRKYRKSVALTPWLNSVMNHYSVKEEALKIPDHENMDTQMQSVLVHVQNKLKYVGDSVTWGMSDYWQKPEQTIKSWHGDCEDGAILIYALAREKGIPANRLMIFCGDVLANGSIGGHAWIGYRPKNYPLAWVFMDWCYYYSSRSVIGRNKFLIERNTIQGFKYKEGDHNPYYANYLKCWFGFNEKGSHYLIHNFQENI